MRTRKPFDLNITQSHFPASQRSRHFVAATLGGMLLLFAAPAVQSGYLDLEWDAPTTNEDETPLTDLQSYHVYYSETSSPDCPGPSSDIVEVPPPTPVGDSVTYRLTGLTEGTPYFVKVTAVNSFGLESACSNEASGIAHADPDPPASASAGGANSSSGGDGGGGGGGAGCFIATAAYGSPLAPQVQRLREVRDRYLLRHPAGRAFVALYYRASPPLAEVIAGSETLRAVVRMALMPIIAWAALLLWSPVLGLASLVAAMVLGPWLVLQVARGRSDTQRQGRGICTGQPSPQRRGRRLRRPVRRLALGVSLFLCVAMPTLLRADPGGDAKAPARVAFTAELRLPELTRFALFRDPEAEHIGLHRAGEPLFVGTDPIPLGKVMAVREESVVIALTGGQSVEIPKGGRLPGRRALIFERSVLLDTLRFQVRYGAPTAPPGAEYSVVEIGGRQAILQRDALPGEGQATERVVAETKRPAGSLATPAPIEASSPPPADRLADLVNRMPLREVAPGTWEVPAKDAMALESHVGELLDETLRSSRLSLTSQSGVALKVETSLGTGTLDRQGFLINNLKLAQRTGLEVGDRILFVNEQPVNSLASLYQLYRSLKSNPGVSEVKVVVTRMDQRRTVTYRLR